jgi:DnaK suppressor protein
VAGKPDKQAAAGKKDLKGGPQGATKAPPPPLKVEPKIIETQEPQYVRPANHGDLFSEEELEMFRGLLEDEKNKILDKARRAMEEGGIQIDKNEMFDEVDQASAMVEQNLMFRLLDRDRKLLAEIEHALAKVDTGDYGYCEGTGEPIPKRRLELRPWCRHSVKYKEKLERMKKSGRGVVDEDEL